ncbi:MAG: DUF4160 domain-containing protein [Treponema sp.]|jgi:hypothetical protein|nr:DUF4160 domain-containing protein [Treponema sp.]
MKNTKIKKGGLAMEWANLHKEELLENWNMIQKDGKYFKIEPLT